MPRRKYLSKPSRWKGGIFDALDRPQLGDERPDWSPTGVLGGVVPAPPKRHDEPSAPTLVSVLPTPHRRGPSLTRPAASRTSRATRADRASSAKGVHFWSERFQGPIGSLAGFEGPAVRAFTQARGDPPTLSANGRDLRAGSGRRTGLGR
jgi:hypothetical protein